MCYASWLKCLHYWLWAGIFLNDSENMFEVKDNGTSKLVVVIQSQHLMHLDAVIKDVIYYYKINSVI